MHSPFEALVLCCIHLVRCKVCVYLQAPMDSDKMDRIGSEGSGASDAVAPRPITNSNFVPSRSKTFDAQRSGNFYGYRRMPEMHSSMTLSQLQDVVHLYYCQAAEDYRAMNLVDTSKKPGRALAEARRHMTRTADRSPNGNTVMTTLNARFGTKSQVCAMWTHFSKKLIVYRCSLPSSCRS